MINVFCEDRKIHVRMSYKEATEHDLKHHSSMPEFRGWSYQSSVFNEQKESILKAMRLCSTYKDAKKNVIPAKTTGNFEFFYPPRYANYDKHKKYSIEMV